MREEFWFNNPKILFNDYCRFFPNKNYSLTTNLNAIVRLFLYYTILCIVFTENEIIDIIKPFLLVSFLTIIAYHNNITETFTNNIVYETFTRQSNKDNPLMNLSIMDYNTNKNIEIDKNITNEEINNNIVGDFPYDDDGGSNRKMLERSFYTMPVTNVVNDQTEFAKWLYDKGPTCKENTTMCYNSLPDRLQMGRGSNSSD